MGAAPLSGASQWVTLFDHAQLDDEKQHSTETLQWADGTGSTLHPLCAPAVVNEWHGVLAACDGAVKGTYFAEERRNPYCAAINNCATRNSCDVDNKSVFARPMILFLIIGGALVLIFPAVCDCRHSFSLMLCGKVVRGKGVRGKGVQPLILDLNRLKRRSIRSSALYGKLQDAPG